MSDGPVDAPLPVERLREMHDFMGDIVSDVIHVPLDADQVAVLSTIGATLCWALGHPGGQRIEMLRAEVERLIAESSPRNGRRPDIGSANPELN